MSELVRQFTSQQWRMFHEAVKDAGINTQPWWEAVPYSGPPKVLRAGLFRKNGWFSKVLIAADNDLYRLERIARYIRHTRWILSCEMDQWQLNHGDFVILQRGAFRGGDRKLVVARLRSFGVEQELIDRALNDQVEEIQGYVLSSTEQEAHALAQIIEQGATTPISPEEYTSLCMQLKEVAESRLCNPVKGD